MKINVDNQQIFELTEIQKKVIKNDIPDEIFHDDMCRRLEYILTHKYERCFERLKKEWEPKLAERVDSIPTSKDSFAQLVFSQPDYKNRTQKDAETENSLSVMTNK